MRWTGTGDTIHCRLRIADRGLTIEGLLDGGTRMAGWPMAGFVKIPGMTSRIGLTRCGPGRGARRAAGGAGDRRPRRDRRHRRHHGQRARVLPPGAVAIDGTDIVGVGTPEAIGSQFTAAPRRSTRPARSCCPASSTPTARADGAVSRPGRRPGADGVAGEVHLPGRSQDGVARDGRDRHPAGRARDDPSRARRRLPTCITSRRRLRRTDQGGRTARRARPDDHQFPVADAKTPAEALARAEALPQGIQGRPAHHAGRGAARGVHARQGDAAGVPRSRRASTACR